MSDRGGTVPKPLPKRPYTYSLLINVALAATLFFFSWLLGGRISESIFYATLYLVVATSWNWWRLRKRLTGEGG